MSTRQRIGMLGLGAVFILLTSGGCPPSSKPTPGDLEATDLKVSPDPAIAKQNNSIIFTAYNKGETDVTCTYIFKAVGPMLPWNITYYKSKVYNVSVPVGASVTKSVNDWRPNVGGEGLAAEVTGEAEVPNDPTGDNIKRIIVAVVKAEAPEATHHYYHILPFPF